MSNEIINELSPLPLDNGQQAPGTICLANESRFAASNLSAPLTTFAVNWRDPNNLQSLLDFVAPPVFVQKRFEFRRATNAEAFFSETDDVRAIGAAFKRVEYTGDSVTARNFNKGLTIRVDHDEEPDGNWQERYVQLLLNRLLRNELRRAISAIDAVAVNTAKTWDINANPDADVRDQLAAAASITGIAPNRVVFGEDAWFKRADSYDRQSNAGAIRSASLTLEELAPRLFVEGVRVLRARWQDSATTKAKILGNTVYAYYAEQSGVKDEPSNLKRFVTPTEQGAYRVYVDEHAKYTDLTVEHYSNIVITSDLGIRKLTIS
jgi:hypothetical protein